LTASDRAQISKLGEKSGQKSARKIYIDKLSVCF